MFEHSEYVGDLISSATAGAFEINNFQVTPVNSYLFPWLSQFALNFEYYQFEGLIFRFESASGQSVASTNTAIGTVMALHNPDPEDTVPSSKSEFLQYGNVVSCRSDQNFLLGAECDPEQAIMKRFYIDRSLS